jgi:hypothetical protein
LADGRRGYAILVDRGNRLVLEDGINICLKRRRPLISMFAILPAGPMGGDVGLGTLLEGDGVSRLDCSRLLLPEALLQRIGVRDYVLIDPDAVETTNLNRLAGAGAADVGAAKIDVAEREIRACSPTARVHGLRADVVDQSSATELTGVDFIFLCTDSHASRAVVCQLAYQHLVPTIDMGVSVGT